MIIGISGKIGSGKDTIAKIIQFLTWRTQNHGLTFEMWLKAYEPGVIDQYSDWQVKKMADKLKEICALMLGVPRAQLEDQEFKDSLLDDSWQVYKINGFGYIAKDIEVATLDEADAVVRSYAHSYTKNVHYIKSVRTVRWLMQYIGTDLFRDKLHPNIHVNMLFSEYVNQVLSEGGERTASDGGYYTAPTYREYPNWIITDVRFPNEAEAIKKRRGILLRVNRDIKFNPKYDIVVATAMNIMAEAQRTQTGPYHPSEIALDNYPFECIIDNNGTIEELVEQVKQFLKFNNIK